MVHGKLGINIFISNRLSQLKEQAIPMLEKLVISKHFNKKEIKKMLNKIKQDN
ncbi:hypothetical protein [Candidatus Uabimicrobium sp. HlEnr_7]|uniref:hypothetical protein n=1 Tax=Candidatus Uabimicrobium helgolandensis TaxID=3095367 RepID=UPI0035585FD1